MIVSLSVKSHIVNVSWVTVCFGYCRVARWLILCGLSLSDLNKNISKTFSFFFFKCEDPPPLNLIDSGDEADKKI